MLFKKILIFSFLFCLNLAVFAVDDGEVRILRVSSTGQTFEVNRGLNERVQIGEYSFLIQKELLNIGKTIFKPILQAKCIRVYDDRSIWISFLRYENTEIKAGQNYVFLYESNFVFGRKNLESKRLKFIVENPEDVNRLLKDDAQELVKKKSDYIELEPTHKVEKQYDTDLELVDVDLWKARMGDNKLYADGLYKSPHAKEFSRRVRVQTFEKMVVAYLNKFNDVNFSYDDYFQAEKDKNDGKSTNFFGSYYERYKEKELTEYQKNQRYYEKVKKNGDSWSKDYTDQQLSELLSKMSDVKEKMRRQEILAFRYDHQFAFSFGLNLVDNENLTDSETTETSKYSVELLYEKYLFKSFSFLEGVTFGLSGRYAKDAFFGGDLNLATREYSMAGHINYYPYRKPSSINHAIFYVGALFRYGVSRITNSTSGEEGNYYVKTFPGLRLGLKWNLESGVGAFVNFGYENINVERVETSNADGVLPNRSSYVDGRINFGVSKFF